MRNAPSIKRLVEAFPQIDRKSLEKVRKCIHQGKGLAAIDKLLENFGVEYIADRFGATVAIYSNSGDIYAPTILYVYPGRITSPSYRLTTVGDFVEIWEKRHARLP